MPAAHLSYATFFLKDLKHATRVFSTAGRLTQHLGPAFPPRWGWADVGSLHTSPWTNLPNNCSNAPLLQPFALPFWQDPFIAEQAVKRWQGSRRPTQRAAFTAQLLNQWITRCCETTLTFLRDFSLFVRLIPGYNVKTGHGPHSPSSTAAWIHCKIKLMLNMLAAVLISGTDSPWSNPTKRSQQVKVR